MTLLKQAFLILLTATHLLTAADKPNFVLIFTDNQGYGDLGCFGSKTIRTQTAALASTIDLLPTIAALTHTPLPADRIIDGVDISPLLTGDAGSPRKELIYFMRERVEAIREGDWKLLVKPMEGKSKPTLMLFNLAKDIGEKKNLAAEHPRTRPASAPAHVRTRRRHRSRNSPGLEQALNPAIP